MNDKHDKLNQMLMNNDDKGYIFIRQMYNLLHDMIHHNQPHHSHRTHHHL